MHNIILDCKSQKAQFESKFAIDNALSKEARELSKNDFKLLNYYNDGYYKVYSSAYIY